MWHAVTTEVRDCRRRLIAAVWVVLLGVASGNASEYVCVSVAGTKTIRVFELRVNGDLQPQSAVAVPGEPGASVVHPGGRFLYASLRSTGQLASLSIDPEDGSLTLINVIDAGADPAFVAVDRTGRWLFSAYYRAGKVSVHRLSPRGEIYPWPTHSVATDRNAHAALVERSNSILLVPHTGPNAIFQFRFREQSGLLSPCSPPVLKTKPGSGPRHVAFHPRLDLVYADNEQGSSVTRFKLDRETGTLSALETVSSLPDGLTGRNTCARMEISPDGTLLFVSNRGHDSIAAIGLAEDGSMQFRGAVPTEKTPRGFALSTDGRFLVAAGQGSGKLATYSVRSKNTDKVLTRLGTIDAGPRPWWVTAFDLKSRQQAKP